MKVSDGRLTVLNRDKRLVGIIALGDIARAIPGDGTAEVLHHTSQPGSGPTHLA